jgi:hypothetical protein
LSPPEGGNVKQKAGHFEPARGTLEPLAAIWDQGKRSFAMPLRSCLAGLAVALSVAASPARAAVCMNTSMAMDAIIEAINATKGCAPAMKLFTDCAFGASGDVQLGEAVEKKCEADFLSGLKGSQNKAYAGELSRCDRKYRNESGTMYRSFTAFCRAEVSQRYSLKALKAGPKAR